MKHIIRNIILFILSITFFFCIYVYAFKISVFAICILLALLFAYGMCMGESWRSMEKLKKYEQKLIHFGLGHKDYNRILYFSLTMLLPTYFCVFLVSLVPLYTYEVWFISVFPCIFLNILPASSVLDEYFGLTRKKLPFLLFFSLIVFICCSFGIIISHIFLK